MIDVLACAASAPAFVRLDPPALAERLIGELFGWEFARAVPLFEGTAREPAIFPELLPRYLRGDPITARYPALAPSPVVDRCLNRLVQIARSEFEPVRSPLREREVRAHLLARLHSAPELARRAHTLRHIAALAETAMEQHFSVRLLDQLRAVPTPAAESAAGPERLQRLIAYLSGFPYLANYLYLVCAELELVAHAAAPSRDRSFAVIGCGPLPLSGVLLHARTGARVTLVDLDPHSAARAAELVAELERIRVLEPGRVRALAADAAEPSTWSAAEHDVVLVASLVPQASKLRLARALPAAVRGEPPALLLRSAAGLCAALAYEPVPARDIARAGFAWCGASVPAHLLEDDGVPLVIAHASVLNTTELYRARPLPGLEHPCPTHDRNDCCS